MEILKQQKLPRPRLFVNSKFIFIFLFTDSIHETDLRGPLLCDDSPRQLYYKLIIDILSREKVHAWLKSAQHKLLADSRVAQ